MYSWYEIIEKIVYINQLNYNSVLSYFFQDVLYFEIYLEFNLNYMSFISRFKSASFSWLIVAQILILEENVKFTPPNYYAAAFSKISSFLLITIIAMNQAGLELQVNDENICKVLLFYHWFKDERKFKKFNYCWNISRQWSIFGNI